MMKTIATIADGSDQISSDKKAINTDACEELRFSQIDAVNTRAELA